MVSVTCTFKDCAYRGKRGVCHRKHIILQQTREECNELYCLGWSTKEQRIFNEICEVSNDQ